MTRAPSSHRLAVSAILVAALTACSPSDGDDVQSSSASRNVYAVNMVACMTGKGWEVEAYEQDNSWGSASPIPDAQLAQFDEDSASCEKSLGYDVPPPPMTNDEAAQLFEHLQDVAECIRELGYDVPEPPSQHVFVEEVTKPAPPSWHPYDGVAESMDSPEELHSAEDQCPVE